MKLNKKKFFKFIGIIGITAFLTYSTIESLAFGNSEDKSKSQKELVDLKPIVKSPNYAKVFKKETVILDSLVSRKAKVYDINGSVLVAYKDQIIYQKDFGYKNPIKKEPLTPGMSFQLASVSKQFTAASILKLHEEGNIDINKPVKNYLPDFRFEDITVKNLLKHRSGLWNYMYLTERYWDSEIAPDNLEVIDLINSFENRLNFSPGKHFSYSNTGYVVLGAIVEKVSGKTLKDYLKDTFFLPHCLDETFINLNEKNQTEVLNGYQPYGRSYVKLPAGFHNNAFGDKGVYASSNDLFMWFTKLKNGEILKPETVDLMFGNDLKNEDPDYGMGFRLKNEDNERIIYHNGLWDGFRNGLEYHPNEDLVFIVLTHTQNKRKRYFQDYLIEMTKNLISLDKEKIAKL
ncbi:serine hydrolase domain-containing protein [Psychroflexus aestuariivivens]|uniref:serine hydrolase domain-containing protein n=1 Tax=Psychroflexus aestuariivivens TaxID=1795040 RepID=UPI000FD7577C|nr:serine hydrolase domain-containing protein [Psychroflexus aestuariivivens]